MAKKLPTECPACGGKLKVKQLICESCETSIEGSFKLPILARLDAPDQAFLLEFIKTSGSLKEMASLLGLSYPTVRNMLDDIIAKIKATEDSEEKKSQA